MRGREHDERPIKIKKKPVSSAPTSARTLPGSAEAKRLAAGVLEVLSGMRGPQEASEGLSTSLARYYQLETRALGGLIAALEPRPKGRVKKPADEIAGLVREKEQLTRELQRAQALVRAAQRSVGINAVGFGSKVGTKGKKPVRRTRRATIRVERTLEALREPLDIIPAVTVATEG